MNLPFFLLIKRVQLSTPLWAGTYILYHKLTLPVKSILITHLISFFIGLEDE